MNSYSDSKVQQYIKIIMECLMKWLQRKMLSLITPRISLRTHPFVSGQGMTFDCRKNSFYNRQKFLLASCILLDLIHLRINYSSIDALLCDGLDLGCYRCRGKEQWRGQCHAPATIWTVLFSAPYGSICLPKWSLCNMAVSDGVTRLFFPLLRNEGVWAVPTSRGQDLQSRHAAYRISSLTTALRSPIAYVGFVACAPWLCEW